MLRLLCSLLLFSSTIVQAALIVEQPISLELEQGSLRGTLLLPISQQPIAIALLHPGSGPTDRNGNQAQAHNDSMRKLARALAAQGIASLRYDKRGVAASLSVAPDERELRVEDYRDDLIAWSHKLQQDPRFDQQILIGHSEGALIATLAAPHTTAQALILLAGSGRPIEQVLNQQLQAHLSPAQLRYSQYLLAQIKAGNYPQLAPSGLEDLLRPSVQPYLSTLLQQDPSEAFAATQQPALIVQGDRDIQVSPVDAKALSQARPDAQLTIISGMDHVLMSAQSQPLANYNRPDLPLSDGLLTALYRFLHEQGMLATEVFSAAADSPNTPLIVEKNLQ